MPSRCARLLQTDELINLSTSVDDSPLSACLISTSIYTIVCAMLVGLNAVGSTMADPFGNDDTDFDTQKICNDAYNNAVAYLAAGYLPEKDRDEPGGPLEAIEALSHRA